MTISLNNLLARAPSIHDLDAVAKLIITCDIIEDGVSHCTKEDLCSDWQSPDFNLATDAWVIVTTRGQVVSYACVSHSEHERIYTFARVHPEYRNRGIGTLLLRLAEVRARQHVSLARPGTRVTLNNTVNHVNKAARRLLEHEGYTSLRSFWRIVVELNKVPLLFAGMIACTDAYQWGQSTVELVVDSHGWQGVTRLYGRAALQVAQQYDVYEKELRPGQELQVDEERSEQLLIV